MNSDALRVETDVLPPEFDRGDGGFAGRSLSALVRPPVTHDRGVGEWAPGLARLTRVTDVEWVVNIEPHWSWCDGSAVTAADLIAHWSAETRDPLLRFLRTQVIDSIQMVSHGSASLKLRRSTRRFPLLLTGDSARPHRKAQDSAQTRRNYGLFDVLRVDGGQPRSARLTRRAARAAKSTLPSCIKISESSSHEEGLAWFASKDVDVTCCTTATPLSVREHQHAEFYRSSRLRLYARLVFDPSRFAPHLKEVLDQAIDRDRIAMGFSGILAPLSSPGGLWLPHVSRPAYGGSGCSRASDLASGLPSGTRFYYAAYSPNEQVVRALCTQLASDFGVMLQPYAVPLDELVQRCMAPGSSLCYSLASPPFDDPSAIPAVHALQAAAAKDLRALSVALDLFNECCGCAGMVEAATTASACASPGEICLFEVRANYLSRSSSVFYSPLGRLNVC